MKNDDLLKTAHTLKKNKEKVLALWSERARQEIPAASGKSELVLRDALPHFLNNLARALSPNDPEDSSSQTDVSEEHAEQRDRQGDYSLRQVLEEYFILQKTIFEVLEVETGSPLTSTERDTVLESMAIGIKEAGVKFAELQMSHLERSNEALEHFAHIASHDLQEPLRTIVNHLGLVQKKLGGELSSDLAESFNFVTDAAKRMKSLIDSLLIYSQVGHANEQKILTDLNLVFNHVVANLQVAIKDSGARVVSDPLPSLIVLPVEMERLFQNLINNAIKYRGDNPPVVHVSAVQRNSEWIFSVSDNGIGVEAGQEVSIFKMFSRLHSRNQIPGSGIGLSICRRVAELHDGSIWVEPSPHGGTTFRFSISSKL